MKFCRYCGKEIMDEAVICPACGCSVKKVADQEETPNIANYALVFSFLIPVVGLILGIIGACKYKSQQYKGKSLIAIGVSIVMWIFVYLIILFFINNY